MTVGCEEAGWDSNSSTILNSVTFIAFHVRFKCNTFFTSLTNYTF